MSSVTPKLSYETFTLHMIKLHKAETELLKNFNNNCTDHQLRMCHEIVCYGCSQQNVNLLSLGYFLIHTIKMSHYQIETFNNSFLFRDFSADEKIVMKAEYFCIFLFCMDKYCELSKMQHNKLFKE